MKHPAKTKEQSSSINTASFSHDGERLVTAGRDGTARTWDAKTGKPLKVVIRHERSVLGASFSPDDRHRTGSRKTVADVAFSPRAAIAIFAIYIVISLAGTFQSWAAAAIIMVRAAAAALRSWSAGVRFWIRLVKRGVIRITSKMPTRPR